MMPTIAIVEGVAIILWLNDHAPPHFHARIAEHEAKISIETGDVLDGHLPKHKLKAVLRWLDQHRDEVAFAWSEIRSGRPL
jgi:Domain of unknown function (DUF4160)